MAKSTRIKTMDLICAFFTALTVHKKMSSLQKFSYKPTIVNTSKPLSTKLCLNADVHKVTRLNPIWHSGSHITLMKEKLLFCKIWVRDFHSKMLMVKSKLILYFKKHLYQHSGLWRSIREVLLKH